MQMYIVNTGHKHYLHKPIANLSCFQKSTYYSMIKIFNNMPYDLTSCMNEKAWFKIALKPYLHTDMYLMNTYCLKSDSSILNLCKHELTVLVCVHMFMRIRSRECTVIWMFLSITLPILPLLVHVIHSVYPWLIHWIQPPLVQINEEHYVITETGYSVSSRHSDDKGKEIINKCIERPIH
jgi:hypothetical protein